MIAIVVQEISPRIEYVVQEIDRRSSLQWKISDNQDAEELQVRYGLEATDQFYNVDCGENQLLYQTVKPGHASKFVNGRVFLNNAFLDSFETIFWALSRYEEYDFQTTDPHGRFGLENTSISEDIVRQPWIDQLIRRLEDDVLRFYNAQDNRPKSSIKVIPTFDIDHAFAFQHKPWWVKFAGFFKDYIKKDEERYRYRWSTLLGKGKDPYDTHQEVMEVAKKHEGYVFFLLGNRGKFDKNISWKNATFRKLIIEYQKNSKTGIHPSYASNGNPSKLENEAARLHKITGNAVQYSRQHFLKVHLPETFNNLVGLGVKEDHSMAFFDTPGFRAGTAYPFFFFDFKENTSTDLQIYPVVYMDGTLNEYMKCSIEQAKEIIDELYENMKPTGGHFECIWHNETIANFGKWKGWKNVLDHTLKKA